MNTVSNLAKRMQLFNDQNIGDVFRSAYVKKHFDKELNKQLSEALCDPTKTMIFLQSRSFEGTTDK